MTNIALTIILGHSIRVFLVLRRGATCAAGSSMCRLGCGFRPLMVHYRRDLLNEPRVGHQAKDRHLLVECFR